MSLPDSVARRLVDLACLAPSVHNTQPWTWMVDGDRVRLFADRTRQLPVEDPSGRNLVLSCGAALHHFRFAAEALGWHTTVRRLPEAAAPDLLAEVRLERTGPSPTAADDLAVLRRRCTDRRRFTSWPVPDPLLAALADEAAEEGALAEPVVDVVARFRLELLSRRAQSVRDADPLAVREQLSWVRRGGDDGIPRAVLPAETSSADAARRSRFGTGVLDDVRAPVESGDGVIALGGFEDVPEEWLRAGEGLSALWLRATRDGLSVVPLTLPVEVDDVRQELRDAVLGGAFIPHLLVRIGWQAIGRSELPRTPRRPVDDVLIA
ncbi:hypothetical protein [Nocardioides sp. TF02-7]|uniref:Acg family FMN-binding oxidoreductase n=1 Tax=Nocardioides sp. TF02-7 TaxID=2917724 RepID=UPI001F053230|nr:hypothetical protein [Nocardioides sp. TF02-7]UMG91898.1 hypothetical protein MF408_18005 [Nocardioides sp. TF02-7]